MLKSLGDIPVFAQSRKFAILIVTFFVVSLLAIIGTVLSFFFGTEPDLFREAMFLVTGGGVGGTAAQAIPDTVQAKTGDYHRSAEPRPELVIDYTDGTSTSTPTMPRKIVKRTPKPPTASSDSEEDSTGG